MEKTIKANKDNDRKFLEGLNFGVPNSSPEKNEEKKESTENNDGNLEYFCE